MEIPHQTWLFSRIILRYLSMQRNGQIAFTLKALEKERLNTDEINFAFGFFLRNEIIYDLKHEEVMEEFSPGCYDIDRDDRRYIFKVNKEKLRGILDQNDKESEDCVFDDKRSVLKIGSILVQLPPFKSEYYFCKAIFQFNAAHPVDWSEIFEKMYEDQDDYDSEKAKRKIYDIVRTINQRITKETAGRINDFFKWDSKTIKRG